MNHQIIAELIARLQRCSSDMEELIASGSLPQDAAKKILLLAENITNEINLMSWSDICQHGHVRSECGLNCLVECPYSAK